MIVNDLKDVFAEFTFEEIVQCIADSGIEIVMDGVKYEKKVQFEYPTDKQLNFISTIEKRLHVKFKGRSKQDAYEFIRDNKSKLNKK